MNSGEMENLSERDRQMMGIDTSPKTEDPIVDKSGTEQPFSKEGLLNRNFGKDVTKPSSVDMYSNGVLNRAKMAKGFENGLSESQSQSSQQTRETESSEEKTIVSPEITDAEPPVLESSTEETKPIMALMVEAYSKLSDDPEKSAYDALYERLDSNMPEEEKQQHMRDLGEEYRHYKEQAANNK